MKSAKYWRAATAYREQDKRLEEARAMTREQTIEEMSVEVATYAQRQAIDALNEYHVNQQGEATCKRGKEAAGLIIRQYLELNDETEIEDAERGLKAILASRRQGKDNYDVRSLDWKLVKKLHAAGCLLMDVDMLNQKANAALRMECEPQKVPAGEVTYLRVVKE